MKYYFSYALKHSSPYIFVFLAIIGCASTINAGRFIKDVGVTNIDKIKNIDTNLDNKTSFDLYKIVNEVNNELESPSLQISVYIKDKGYWNCSIGYSDLDTQRELTNNDLFQIGSMTKMFTSAAILTLVDKGRLSLNDPISRYLPFIANGDKITIRNLLNHSSGIYDYSYSFKFGMGVITKKKWTVEEKINLIREEDAYFKPGKGYHYSNTNYFLLGLVIEKVTDQSIARFLRTHILIPYQLNRTYTPLVEEIPNTLVRGYDQKLTPLGWFGIRHDVGSYLEMHRSWLLAGGNMVSTSSNINHFLHNLVDGPIFNKKIKQELTGFIDGTFHGVPEQIGYGLGLRRILIDGVELWGHTGLFFGYEGVALHSPKHSYTITILSGLSGIELMPLYARLQRYLLKK